MNTYTTEFLGENFSIRADFSNASCSIQRMTEDGWEDTGRQVADFRHSPAAAMEYELMAFIAAGGDDPDGYDLDIDAAVEEM